MSSNAQSPFPPMPISGITIPSTALILAALEYTKSHTSPTTVNHCLRSAAFAIIIARKHPAYSGIDLETITLSTILHDMGWATTKSLLSEDKRFEVDGANLAREFLQREMTKTGGHSQTHDDQWLQLIWDAVALHTTPSIALYKQPEVAVTSFGILGDFLGPNHPTGMITVDEYKEVVRAFPRLDFREELPQIMCGLCETKPGATYDNFVGDFGIKLGVEGYKEKWEKNQMIDVLIGGLDGCKQYEE